MIDLKNVPFNWRMPTTQNIDFARTLIRTFIKPEMERLQAWADSKIELSKSQLKKSLSIVARFTAFGECFPAFVGSKIAANKAAYFDEDIFAIPELFDGEPMRDQLCQLLFQVLHRLCVVMPDSVSVIVDVFWVGCQ